MKEKITPCLWFDQQAKEAGAFYCAHFPKAKIVAQSHFVTDVAIGDQHLTLLDGGPMYKPNPSISFFYICETAEELHSIWTAFSEKGQVLMPLDMYPWSPQYGWINDQFGISWQFSLGKIEDVGQKITPSLLFTGEQNGRAEEAINFYSSVFKEPTLDGILRYDGNANPEEKGKVMHAQLGFNGQKFMLGDGGSQPHQFIFSEGVSLTINCENQEEVDYYWNRLTEGGQESMCGWLKDKFGVSWQVVPTMLTKLMNDPEKAGKAAKAFMQMKKLEIEKIVQAAIA